MLRSMRLGEADRVLHLYTLDRGRVGAVAKGIRRTKSRFGARLEPLSHVELLLHHGSGELGTVTGVDLVRSHHAAREQPYRLGVALVGAEAMLRLFTEQERNERAFTALTRFLDLVDELLAGSRVASGARPARALLPAQAALALRLPPASRAAARNAGRTRRSSATCRRPAARSAAACSEGALPVSPGSFGAIDGLLRRPLAEAGEVPLGERARARGAGGRLGVVRVPRRLSAAHALGLSVMRPFAAAVAAAVLALAGCAAAATTRSSARKRARPPTDSCARSSRTTTRSSRERYAVGDAAAHLALWRDPPAPRRRPHRRRPRERARELPQGVPGLRPAAARGLHHVPARRARADRRLDAHARDDGALPRLARRARATGGA